MVNLLGAIGIGAVLGWLTVGHWLAAHRSHSWIAIAITLSIIALWIVFATPWHLVTVAVAAIITAWLHLVWRGNLTQRDGGANARF